jgi:hypothetical protein
MSPTSTDLDGLRRLIAIKTSESGTGARDKNSDDERVGRRHGKDFCILTENSLKIHQQHHNVRLNAYHQPQDG